MANLSPDLRYALNIIKRGYQPSTGGSSTGFLSKQPLKNNKPLRLPVFLWTEANADFSEICDKQNQINEKEGEIRTGWLDEKIIRKLQRHKSVRYIEIAKSVNALLDEAGRAIELPIFQQKTRLTGRGVIIGIIDTGIDFTHPAFSNRILFIWDQQLKGGKSPKLFNYGQELEAPSFTSRHIDKEGHGTHVANIAAGDGEIYSGVATSADLVIVKINSRTDSIVHAIEYIFDVANRFNRPAVINISYGVDDHSHDAKDMFTRRVNDLVAPGKLIVAAAGNRGNEPCHARIPCKGKCSVELPVYIPDGQRIGTVNIKSWYSNSVRCRFRIMAPSGKVTHYFISNKREEDDAVLDKEGFVYVVTPSQNPSNDDLTFSINLEPPPTTIGKARIAAGTWRILLEIESTSHEIMDFWLSSDVKIDGLGFTGKYVNHSMKLTAPATAPRVIAVAASVSRLRWKSVEDKAIEEGGFLNSIASFSSPGPLRNGERKPDFTAPGQYLVSAWPSSERNLDDCYRLDGNYAVLSGTSMSAPLVTGVVALLLERHPTLTIQAVLEILRSCAVIPEKEGVDFDEEWGYGLLHMSQLEKTLDEVDALGNMAPSQ